MTKAQEKNSKKISSGIPAEKKAFAFSNDMDESFFTYLADLKKLDVPSSLDKDELIWQIDKTMDSMREKIFYLAPAVENLIQILDDVSVNTKSKNDIFFECLLSPWDIAAGYLLITEAGGIMTRLDGTPIDFSAPSPVLAATPAVYEDVLALVKDI